MLTTAHSQPALVLMVSSMHTLCSLSFARVSVMVHVCACA